MATMNKSSPRLIAVTQLDDYTTYYINHKNDIVIEMKGNREMKDDNILRYTRENLISFYSKYKGPLLLSDNLTIIHKDKNLIFIPLFNRQKNLVDYCYSDYHNYDLLSRYTFCRNIQSGNKIYSRSNLIDGEKPYMHEIIYGRKADPGHKIDHSNSNGMDNRTSNIRQLTNPENTANLKPKQDGYRGVSLKNGKWIARIKHNKISYWLSGYETPLEAAKARDVYAVHLYRGKISLNGTLTEDEIQDILENGIPEKYKMKDKKIRDLPTNIYKASNGKSYYYNIEYRSKAYRKPFQTLDECVTALEELKQSFAKEEQIERNSLTNNIDNHRNKDGVAIIRTHNKEGDITGEYELDDEDWKEYVHHYWYIDNGYARGMVGPKLECLHLLIFKKHNPNIIIPPGYTVDHYDMNKTNCRSENLRLATGSQQIQNRKVNRDTRVKYTGVYVKAGKFQAMYCGKFVSSHEFMEDAAKAYNDTAINHDKNARLNIIDNNTRTKVSDLYHKDNLSIEDLSNTKTISEIIEIYRMNEDWRAKGSINNLKYLKAEDIDFHRKRLIEFKMSEM